MRNEENKKIDSKRISNLRLESNLKVDTEVDGRVDAKVKARKRQQEFYMARAATTTLYTECSVGVIGVFCGVAQTQ
jgi:hypothetical protein